MLVLIDESGDPGFKVAKGSTPNFVVAMVIFHDLNQAERCGAAIKESSKRLRVKPEFKFNKCHEDVRDEFFKAVIPFEFQVRALVVDKANIYSEHLRSDTESFYSYFIQMLMRHDGGSLQGANIKIDGSGDREFKDQLVAYLRRQLNAGKIAKVKFSDSKQDTLIQLADMVAGAIARSYRDGDRKNHDRWRNMIACKIKNVWEFR